MTVEQIKGFLQAIHRQTALGHASFISNVAVGAQGDSKAIKKTIKLYSESKGDK